MLQMINLKRTAFFCLFLAIHSLSHGQADISKHYLVEDVPTPIGMDPQVGGIDFTPDGRLAACFHRGEVYTFNPSTGVWKLFAEGLQEPLGLVAVSNHELVVMQRSELTRLQDLDLDGKADAYTNLWNGFGMTGNYHEFAFGPVRDAQGNFYVSLNLASNGASIRPEIRGQFHPIGLAKEDFYDKPWSKVKNIAGRMYSRVPWRGWVIKVSPNGKVQPFASGFRSPNGLGFDNKGNLFVTDNQGDWLGTSKCYHVQKGGFYGHPASLVWKNDWNENPLETPVEKLNQLRSPAAFLFPQGEVANSPTQPICDTTGGKFGPFDGQMLVGEMNVPRILRLLQDEVDGTVQGAVVTFIENAGLRRGIHRLAFSPDKKSLYIGQTALSWAGSKGIQRIKYTGVSPMEIVGIKAMKKGFKLSFNQKIGMDSVSSLPSTYKTWTYHYHKSYGSPKVDAQETKLKSIRISDDGKSLFFETEPHKKGFIHEFNIAGLKSQDGTKLINGKVTYHMVETPAAKSL